MSVLAQPILPTPGPFWGDYPEREGHAEPDRLSRWAGRLRGVALTPARYLRFARRARAAAEHAARLDAAALRAHLAVLAPRLARHDQWQDALDEACGLAVLVCRRQLGVDLYPVQVAAARALLDNTLVELATGEGKTLAIALAAALGGLAGMPVHVVTANDYLVVRDAQGLAPFFTALGLSVGWVTADLDSTARRAAYACDITYCTAKELGFDYLRDRLGRGRDPVRERVARLTGQRRPTRLHGLCMAILDEADSLLIDEATVPLVLAARRDDPNQRLDPLVALDLADRLEAPRDYRIDAEARRAQLSRAGEDRLAEAVAGLPRAWHNPLFRRAWASQALAARHLYLRDRDYLVRDGQVVLIDATTGRAAPGRVWSEGLHALICAKEGLRPPPDQETVARITYPRLFRRYHRLSGLSGTLVEARAELSDTYGTPVLRLPARWPSQLRVAPPQVHADWPTLWRAVATRVIALHQAGRPVLVGTDSVADSEALAEVLRGAGLTCQVLNARQDQAEATLVAQAGLRGRITVATNMAGRGTDIPLGPGVAEAGGLHLIACQHNPARRIDRQLRGRAARQGQPGSVETHLCLESDLLREYFAETWLGRLVGRRGRLWLGRPLAVLARRAAEAEARRTRAALIRQERALEQGLAFGGEME